MPRHRVHARRCRAPAGHPDSRRFIENVLRSASIPTVVVIHHLPHAGSIPDRFKGDLLNAAYASDLTEIIQSDRPALWVHRHTHHSCDHRVTDTRILCKPRGYGDENGRFDTERVVDIADPLLSVG
jgi:hypothetical protein